jgi:hypothetical protein
MTKRLHTGSKIFFPDPYVVMVEHEDFNDSSTWEFQKLVRKVYRLIQGTWGYCTPLPEYVFPDTKRERKPVLSALPGIFVPTYGGDHIYRSYWVFKDEIDALQFRLMVGDKSLHVHMWPKREFTIHEVVETDES